MGEWKVNFGGIGCSFSVIVVEAWLCYDTFLVCSAFNFFDLVHLGLGNWSPATQRVLLRSRVFCLEHWK